MSGPARSPRPLRSRTDLSTSQATRNLGFQAAQVERQREAFRSFDKKELEKSMAATPFISGAEACKRMVLSSIGLNLLWVLQLNNT